MSTTARVEWSDLQFEFDNLRFMTIQSAALAAMIDAGEIPPMVLATR